MEVEGAGCVGEEGKVGGGGGGGGGAGRRGGRRRGSGGGELYLLIPQHTGPTYTPTH